MWALNDVESSMSWMRSRVKEKNSDPVSATQRTAREYEESMRIAEGRRGEKEGNHTEVRTRIRKRRGKAGVEQSRTKIKK